MITALIAKGSLISKAQEQNNNESLKTKNTAEETIIVETPDYEVSVSQEEEMVHSFITSTEAAVIPFEFDTTLEKTDGEHRKGWEIGSISNISELNYISAAQAELPPNTDPNNAYGVRANTEYSGAITQEGEIRWYAFDIPGSTKVSILIKSEAIDPDIYLFKLDTSTMQLESTNLSARNTGTEEYFSCVIGEGIYFFAILGSSGSGTFIMDFFENSDYIDNEINDSVNTAQIFGSESEFIGGSVTGIIDTMRDADFYKLVVVSPIMVHIDFSAPANHSLIWIDAGSSAERLYYENGNCILSAGVHYFAVYDTKGEFYIGNGTYTVSMDVITGNVTSDFKATAYKDYPQYSAILQFYPDRTQYYLNGKLINISSYYGANIGSNEDNPSYRRWSVNLSNGKKLVYNIIGVKTNYNSILEDRRVSRVYFMEIGSADGLVVFGSRVAQQGTVRRIYDITYSIVAIDASTGKVADVIDPDPNPYDSVTPSM